MEVSDTVFFKGVNFLWVCGCVWGGEEEERISAFLPAKHHKDTFCLQGSVLQFWCPMASLFACAWEQATPGWRL